jgi:hypothetical protein
MPQSHARRLAHVAAARSTGRRWRSYLALVGIGIAAVTVIAVFPRVPLRQGTVGLVLGAVAMMIVISMVSLNNPAMDGRLAEQWSLDGLRKVRGWYVTDNLPFEREDVDHVVVAPSAVLAVEPKYHSRAYPGSRADIERHQRDLRAAEHAARKVKLFLTSQQLREPAPVVAVLIVWGAGAPDLPNGHRTDGAVRVVDGRHPELWMHLFNAPRLDAGTRRDLHARIEKFAAVRAKHDAKTLQSVRMQMWQEFRGGVSYERAQRAARHQQVRSLRRRHGLPLLSVPFATTLPSVAPVTLGASPATGFAPTA